MVAWGKATLISDGTSASPFRVMRFQGASHCCKRILCIMHISSMCWICWSHFCLRIGIHAAILLSYPKLCTSLFVIILGGSSGGFVFNFTSVVESATYFRTKLLFQSPSAILYWLCVYLLRIVIMIFDFGMYQNAPHVGSGSRPRAMHVGPTSCEGCWVWARTKDVPMWSGLMIFQALRKLCIPFGRTWTVKLNGLRNNITKRWLSLNMPPQIIVYADCSPNLLQVKQLKLFD